MKKDINIEIGAKIRQKREALHLTREQLADCADLSSQFLAEIELGKKGISPSTIRKLCSALHISADYLILNREPVGDYPAIHDLLAELDDQYLPLVEDLLRTYVESIALSKHSDL